MTKTDPMIGRVLHGTIEIRKKIGAGGMGNVYEGYQEHLDRRVAVKVMTPEHAANPIAARYFLREAQSASKLRHPNIIQIIDFGQEDDDTIFIAMEYIPGLPLTKLIRQQYPFPRERIVTILDQTLAGLVEAHRKQIVHRDLKPDNLMIEQMDGSDFVKVLDFGIAQSKAPERKAGPLTQQGAVVGTPQYMSPEQAAGDVVDGRSDLFSLGIILYEMLTQRAPFEGANLPEILIAVIKHHPQPPSTQRPELTIDPGLEAVCLRALKKDPNLRYQSADEFREALRTIGQQKPAQEDRAAPAQFIFKRAKGAQRSAEPAEDSAPSFPSVVAPSTDGPTEADEDVVAATVLDGAPGTIESHGQKRSAEPIIERAPGGLSETSVSWKDARPKRSGLGVDVDELRGDLLGDRAIVSSLVVHQRSHRRIDPEDMVDLRENIDGVFEEICEQWGAVLHGRQGSFVTLLFGVPTPRPDDSFRAVQAALSLRRKLGQFSPDGTVFGFAIAAGEVFTPSADLSRAAGEPLDDATEASRVAGDDNIVVAGAPLQTRLETMFRLGPLDEESHRPVLGVLDVGRFQQQEAGRRGTELIGRDTEIATLLGAFGRLSKGRGTSLFVVGEPGVGKTAILEEARRFSEQRATRIAVARWRGEGAEAIRHVRLQWLLELVRAQGFVPADAEAAFRQMGLVREYSRLLAAFVHDRMEEAFGFRGRHARTADGEARAELAMQVAMSRLARALTDESPVVFFLDDAIEYSGALVDFLGRWSELTAELPMLVVTGLTQRPGSIGEPMPERAEVMRLMPLEEPAALAFLKVRVPSTTPTNVITRLARVGAGFPVHLEHLARYARSRGDAIDVEAAEEWLSRSRDIAELLRLRLFEQPTLVQNVMALMAALGAGARGDVLVELASAEWEPEEALGKLHADGLIEVVEDAAGEPRVYFRPPALRHVVYDRLSRKMKSRIHARAAAYFEERVRSDRGNPGRDDLVELARHRELAGDPGGALEIYEHLATRAFRQFDYDAGREYLARAIRLLADRAEDAVDRQARLELQLVRADAATGNRKEALDRLRKLDRTDGVKDKLAIEIRLNLAELWLEDEDPDLVGGIVREEMKRTRRLLEPNPDDQELRCLLVVSLQLAAKVHEMQNRLPQAAEHAIEAADLTERGSIDPLQNPWGPRLIWETLNQLGRIRIRLGEFAGARKMFDLAMRVVNESDDRRGEVAVRANMATLQTSEGDVDGAYQNLISAERIARKVGDSFAMARLEYNRGLVLSRQKRLEMSIEAHQESLALAEDLDWREGIAMNIDRLNQLTRDTEDDGDHFLRPRRK